jgi:hypothetical protein
VIMAYIYINRSWLPCLLSAAQLLQQLVIYPENARSFTSALSTRLVPAGQGSISCHVLPDLLQSVHSIIAPSRVKPVDIDQCLHTEVAVSEEFPDDGSHFCSEELQNLISIYDPTVTSSATHDCIHKNTDSEKSNVIVAPGTIEPMKTQKLVHAMDDHYHTHQEQQQQEVDKGKTAIMTAIDGNKSSDKSDEDPFADLDRLVNLAMSSP